MENEKNHPIKLISTIVALNIITAVFIYILPDIIKSTPTILLEIGIGLWVVASILLLISDSKKTTKIGKISLGVIAASFTLTFLTWFARLLL